VIDMARPNIDDIIASADELAATFEALGDVDFVDAAPLRAIAEASVRRAAAERDLRDAVVAARHGGFSWGLIGSYLGVSPQAARQRYLAACETASATA
jgi:hypothetical protein